MDTLKSWTPPGAAPLRAGRIKSCDATGSPLLLYVFFQFHKFWI